MESSLAAGVSLMWLGLKAVEVKLYSCLATFSVYCLLFTALPFPLSEMASVG